MSSTNNLEDILKENQKKYNEKTISNLTYAEIMELNKISRKGTFMDRSWQETATNVLENEDMSRWEKFKAGGYTVKNLTGRASNNLIKKQKMCEYLST